MDRFLAMQTFVRVADAGSFSAVARELGSTQSAISKQVAALERHLGASLLTRSTRHLALTEAGQRYLEEARRLVAEVSEAEAVVRCGERQLSGLLRVAASVGYGRRALMPQVKSFLAVHPDVRIDLRLDDGFIDLVERGIDVAVRIGELADSSLVARRIGTTHRALMASRRYVEGLPRALRTLRSPADLAHHNCIVYTELAVRDAWQFEGPGGASATVRVGGKSADQQLGGGPCGRAVGHGRVLFTDLAVRQGTGQRRRAAPDDRMAPSAAAGAPGESAAAPAFGQGSRFR